MEGSVKERLTGALIFVAAAIIIVPEMFSGLQSKAPDAAVLPAQPEAGPPLRTYSMQLDDAIPARVETPAPAATEAAAPSVDPVESAPQEQVVVQSTAPPPAPEPAKAEPVAKKPPAAPAATASAAAGSWWVQVGLFSSRENAERQAQKLRAAGIDVVTDNYVSNGRDLLRVRAGPARDRAEALALVTRVKATGSDARLAPP